MKNLTISILMLSTLGLSAQTRVPGSYFNVVPREFSATDRPLLHFAEDDKVCLYNDCIEKVAEIPINNRKFEYTLTYAEQTREVKAVTYTVMKSSIERTFDAQNTFEDYLEHERQMAGQDFVFVQRQMDDGRTMLYGYYEWMSGGGFFAFNYFGYKYPRNFYVYDPKDQTLTQQSVSYHVEYTNWASQTPQNVKQEADLEVMRLRYRNLDNEVCHDGGSFVVSQTLFDSDEDYEYVIPKIKLSETPSGPQDVVIDFGGSTNTDDENIVLHQATCLTPARYPVVAGFSIVSSDGGIRHEIDLGDDFVLAEQDELQLITLGGKTYLAAECWDNSSEEPETCTVFYKIDTATRGLQRVNIANHSMNVVQQSHALHINLADNGCESQILVIDTSGRTIAQADAAAGQRTVIIKLATPSGTYNVVRLQKGVPVESLKAIIR